jgi:hypothetical protein
VGGGSLKRTLRVTAIDVTVAGAAKCVYSGSPACLDGVDLGAFGRHAAHSYRVVVTFPRPTVDGGVFACSSLSFAFD